MKDPKILFLTLYTFSLTGGIEKVCRSLAKVLTDLGGSFRLFAMHDGGNDLDPRYLDGSRYRAFSGKKIVFACAAIIAGIKSKTVILSHVNLLIFAKIIKTLAPGTRIIMYAHGIEVWGKLSSWKRKFLQDKVEIWAVSKYTATKLSALHQIAHNRVTIVNNGLDPFFDIPKQFEKSDALLHRYHLKKDQRILFTLTRLSAQEAYKGYDQVLLAMPSLLEKFPDLHYLLAGKADEEEAKRVQKLIEQSGLSNHVTLCGFIRDEELIDHFKLGSVFVMPSTMEGFGIVFIEAAACGAKVIGGNSDGSVDALLNGELGALVDPKDEIELSKAIVKNMLSLHDPLAIQETCLSHFAYSLYLSNINRLLVA